MKKIVVLAHSPNIGGAELALNGLIKDTKRVYEWHIVFTSTKTAESSLIQHAHHVSYLDLPWWCHESHDQPKKILKKRLLNELVKLEKVASEADMLLTNTITIPWLGLIAGKINKPHIWYIHEFGDIDHKLEFILGYKESLEVISGTCSRVLTISNAVKDHISQGIDANIVDIIHQSIDIDRIDFQPPRNSINKLLCLGAIKPSKGQKVVLESMRYLSEYTLDIIGPVADKSYYDQLVALSSEYSNVSVQGRNFDANKELLSHDALLMCSDNEALGRVTLEGLAAGKVVIGFGSISTKDLLGNGRGYLYKTNNPTTLSECVRSVNIKSLDFKKNRKFVEETYGSQSQADDFASCINRATVVTDPTSVHLDTYLEVLETKGLFNTKKAHVVHTAKMAFLPIVPNKLKMHVKKLLRKRT